jgi:hypothetical protein
LASAALPADHPALLATEAEQEDPGEEAHGKRSTISEVLHDVYDGNIQ